MPRLYLTRGDHANAFATGRDSAHAAVAMTEGLLVNLPLEQIRGALAHELSHIKNRDTLVWLLTATVAGALSAMVSVLGLAVLLGSMGEAGGPLGLLGALAAMLLAPLGAMLLQLGVSRRREYRADATAAELLGSGAPLGDALEEIASDRGPLQIKPVSATMSNANPLAGRTVSHLFATHPPVAERIRRLCVGDAAQRDSEHRTRSEREEVSEGRRRFPRRRRAGLVWLDRRGRTGERPGSGGGGRPRRLRAGRMTAGSKLVTFAAVLAVVAGPLRSHRPQVCSSSTRARSTRWPSPSG